MPIWPHTPRCRRASRLFERLTASAGTAVTFGFDDNGTARGTRHTTAPGPTVTPSCCRLRPAASASGPGDADFLDSTGYRRPSASISRSISR